MSNGTLNRIVPTLLIADRAALAALVGYSNGEIVSTISPPATWRFRVTLASSPDPRREVRAGDDSGTWFRHLAIGEPGGNTIPEWYINADLGSDDNPSGSDDNPLASIQEMLYRLGQQPIDGYSPFLSDVGGIVYVYLNGTFFDPLTIDVSFVNDGGLAFVGNRTVLTSHTISAVTPWNSATGVIGSYTVSGTALSTNAAGKFMRISGGARQGNKAPIAKVITGGVGGSFRANWADQATNGGVIEPQVGDPVDIIYCTVIAADIRIRSGVAGTNGGTVYFEACELGIVGQNHSVVVESGQASFTACVVHGLDFYEGVVSGLLNTCLVNECRSYSFVDAAGTTFKSIGGTPLSARGGGIIRVSTRCLVQGGGISVGHVQEGPGHIRCLSPIACADYTPSAALVMAGSSIVLDDVLTARDAAPAPLAVQVMSGGQFFYASTKAPVIVGTNPTNDYKIGGTFKAKGAIPYFEVLNGAVVAVNQ